MYKFVGCLISLRDILLALSATITIVLSTIVRLLRILLVRPLPSSAERMTGAQGSNAAASIIISSGSLNGVGDKEFRSIIDAVTFDRGQHEVIVIGSPEIEAKNQYQTSHLTIRYLDAANDACPDPWKEAAIMAKNSIIVFLAGTTLVDRGFLRPMLDSFKDPDVFAVAADPIYPDSLTNQTSGRTRGEFRRGAIHLWRASKTATIRDEEPVLWASREAGAFRREQFLKLGAFPSIFNDTDYADADICFRAWSNGWKVVLQHKSIVKFQNDAGNRHTSLDLQAMDQILFNWSNLSSPKLLLKFQAALVATLFAKAVTGRLNLRPLRYALCRLPHFFSSSSPRPVFQRLSENDVLQVSSHQLLLNNRRQMVECSGQIGPKLPSKSHQSARTGKSGPFRILLVFPQLPYPPTHGGAVRMWNVLTTLAARNTVDVLTFAEPQLDPDEIATSKEKMEQFCRRVRIIIRRPVDISPNGLDRTIHFEMFDCRDMKEALLDMVADGNYDIIQYHKTELGQYLLPKPAPIQVLVEHGIFYYAYHRQFVNWKRPDIHRLIEYWKLRYFELDWCKKFDAVLTMSSVDADFLRRRLPFHQWIMEGPNGVDTEHYRYNPTRRDNQDLLFIGNFDHSPNVDGIRFFLIKVYPSLKATIPGIRLFIVGPGRYDTIKEVAADGSVIPTGLVKDTRPYMDQCSVFIAPILAGSGTRVKILEAMAAGIPVVSTTIGAEGINAIHGEHILLADQPDAFAECILKILKEQDLRERLQRNARNLVETNNSWQVIGKRLQDIYGELLLAHNRTHDGD